MIQSSMPTCRNSLQCHPLVFVIGRLELHIYSWMVSYFVKLKIDLVANTARVTTNFRQIVENLNARLFQMKLGGVHHEIPQQYLLPSGSEPTPEQTVIFVWLCVIDCVYRRMYVYLDNLGDYFIKCNFSMKPFLTTYDLPPNMTYADVGRLLLLRLKNYSM